MSSPPQYPRGKHSFEHVEVSGRRIVVEHIDRRTRTFFERAEALAGQEATKPEAVRAFVFGPENPILATHPTLPGAYPDAATIKNPLYWVCVDIVLRAEARAARISLARASAPFTTTIAEAARKLNRHPGAILNAINNRTLHAWVQDGRIHLLPAEVAAYDVPRRGRPPRQPKP